VCTTRCLTTRAGGPAFHWPNGGEQLFQALGREALVSWAWKRSPAPRNGCGAGTTSAFGKALPFRWRPGPPGWVSRRKRWQSCLGRLRNPCGAECRIPAWLRVLAEAGRQFPGEPFPADCTHINERDLSYPVAAALTATDRALLNWIGPLVRWARERLRERVVAAAPQTGEVPPFPRSAAAADVGEGQRPPGYHRQPRRAQRPFHIPGRA